MAEITGLAEFLVSARLADRNVHVSAQIALFHVAVAGAERHNDGFELLHIGRRFERGPDIRLGDDLHQRDAGAVEIDIGGVWRHVVNGLARILFQMQTLDAHREGIGRIAMRRLHIHLDLALADDGKIELRDLIALRQVGVEIVLPVEAGVFVDLRLQAEAGTHRLLDAFAVDHGQHAGHRGINQRDIAVRVRAKACRGTGKQLRLGGDLGVNLEAHHQFPVPGLALQRIGRPLAHQCLPENQISSPRV